MRSNMPLRGNPWPHDMVISVDTHVAHVIQLLFVRQAWGISAAADIPELEPHPGTGSSRMPAVPDAAEWERRWQRAWYRAWDWYAIQAPLHGVLPSPEEIRNASRPGQPLHPHMPPFWTAEYGWDGIDREACSVWERTLVLPPVRRPVLSSPEHLSLPALIQAWESGLDSIIVLPYAGYYARRITARHLVVSASTRDLPESYARALATRM